MAGSGRDLSAEYRRNRALLLATTDLCGLCGHPGARTADHIIPPSQWPTDAYGRHLPGLDALTNLQPAHGTMGNRVTGQQPNRCPICRRLCNQAKNNRTVTGLPRSRKW